MKAQYSLQMTTQKFKRKEIRCSFLNNQLPGFEEWIFNNDLDYFHFLKLQMQLS